MNNYKINPNKKQLTLIKEYWKKFQSIVDCYNRSIDELEREMSKVTKIKDLEFFKCDGDAVGVGQYDRKMRLIQREELEN
jgi:hypothetical protein